MAVPTLHALQHWAAGHQCCEVCLEEFWLPVTVSTASHAFPALLFDPPCWQQVAVHVLSIDANTAIVAIQPTVQANHIKNLLHWPPSIAQAGSPLQPTIVCPSKSCM